MKTLRLLLSLVIALATCTPVAAEHYKPHISVGAHGGATMSMMAFSPGIKQSFSQGLTMGASFTYAEERHVGLRAELNLVQRGWAENYEDLPFQYSRKFTYISVPMLTHIFFGSRKLKCIFNLGPEVSYMIGKSISSNFDYRNIGSVEGYPSARHTDQLTLDVANRFDYGITAGAGAEYVINRRNSIQLEIRYYFGIGNVFPSQRTDTFHGSRCMDLALTLGYKFRLK
ncbi:MAG: PorT family protein [Muribaculaceae bacterium]|nr:PorT family protein [Muribaculaceae bacterium]